MRLVLLQMKTTKNVYVNKFKLALKKFLLAGSFYSIDEFLHWSTLGDLNAMYIGYPESKFRWAINKKTRIYYKPFILPFDVHTVHYFLT